MKEPEKNTKNINVPIGLELHRACKRKADSMGIPLKDLVVKALAAYAVRYIPRTGA